MLLHYMGLVMTKSVFVISDKARLKPVSSASETSYEIEISPLASLYMILSKKQTAKVLINLRRDAQAGLHLCCSQTLKTGFLPSRPIIV